MFHSLADEPRRGLVWVRSSPPPLRHHLRRNRNAPTKADPEAVEARVPCIGGPRFVGPLDPNRNHRHPQLAGQDSDAFLKRMETTIDTPLSLGKYEQAVSLSKHRGRSPKDRDKWSLCPNGNNMPDSRDPSPERSLEVALPPKRKESEKYLVWDGRKHDKSIRIADVICREQEGSVIGEMLLSLHGQPTSDPEYSHERRS